MVRKAFTLIEIITTIAILSIIASISIFSIDKLYKEFNKAKKISNLSLEAKRVSIQLENLLSSKIPSTLIGYDMKNNSFESIYNLTKKHKILEWLSFTKDSFQKGECSFFIDMKRCDKHNKSLFSPDTNLSMVNERVKKKFLKSGDLFRNEDIVLIFSGSFDNGVDVFSKNFKNFYGWHGHKSEKIIKISQNSESEKFFIKNLPKEIYEKYYLSSSAYAIAKGEDIDKSSACIKNLPIKIKNSSLLLFYDYRPWKKESFCADKNAQKKEGKVTILSQNIKDFSVSLNNDNLILNLTFIQNLIPKKSIEIFSQRIIF